MTTVFADAKTGVIVCDSKISFDTIWYPATKVFRVGDELVGYAGNVKEAHTWLKWYRGGKKGTRPKLDDFVALVLNKDGLYQVSGDGLEMLIERGFHGIGTGGPVAVGAFMAGADAERAVRIACEVDNASGGDVVVHSLKPQKG